MFHHSVSWRQQASSSPPPPRRSPLGRRRSRVLSHAATHLRAGKQELAVSKSPVTPPSFYLALERPLHFLPFTRRHRHRKELELEFVLGAPTFPISSRHHVRHHSTPQLSPPEPPRTIGVSCATPSSSSKSTTPP
jgi:hypothetical protein